MDVSVIAQDTPANDGWRALPAHARGGMLQTRGLQTLRISTTHETLILDRAGGLADPSSPACFLASYSPKESASC
jgi:hypothetical protein